MEEISTNTTSTTTTETTADLLGEVVFNNITTITSTTGGVVGIEQNIVPQPLIGDYWGTPESAKAFSVIIKQGYNLLKSLNTTIPPTGNSESDTDHLIFFSFIVIGLFFLQIFQCWTCFCVRKNRRTEKEYYRNNQHGVIQLPMHDV